MPNKHIKKRRIIHFIYLLTVDNEKKMQL